MVPRSGGQFSALIAKSCIEQVGGGGIEVVGELLWCSLASLRGGLALVASRPLQPRSRSRYNPCAAAAAAIQSQSTAARHHRPVATKPRNVCQAVNSSCQKLSPTAAKLSSCCHTITLSHLKNPLTPPLSTISHQAASTKPLPQVTAAEKFEKK